MGSGSSPLSVRRSVLVACIIGLICAAPAPGQSVCEVDHVSASDGGGFQNFGRAVAVSGDTSLMGAKTDNDNGLESGSAYVFRVDGTGWGETQKLLASDGVSGDSFGRTVAVDGSTLMVGAPGHNHGPGFGSVYVFVHDGSQWVETQELAVLVGDLGGVVVSLDGDVAVVGNWADNDNGSSSGAAHTFRFDPESALWLQEQKLLASDGAAGDQFGISVDVSGDVALIGALNVDFGIGSAYVFRFDGASWVQEQKLTASDGTIVDHFGSAVSLSGEAALIGASNDIPGSAYVFELDPKTSRWVELQKLVASDGAIGNEFGDSVALQGSTALIGAWASDAAGLNEGAAYVFRLLDGTWLEQQRLLPAPGPWTTFFGRSVALSGDVALIGANGEDAQAGGAYMYTGLVGLDCNANGRSDACDILFGLREDANGNGIPDTCECPWDLDGGGTVGIKDFLALLAAWGPNPGHPADFDGDGVVGITDFLALLANWGACP